ncbi:MAG: hypothetical protein A2103_01320 [Gammaproteobacteria bacterium GWF2_41_13]|nr:MAG: hypothetical protein A2103_01320 [Gammaproteobacteria bacterium GWF2_41_13]
MYAQKSSSDNNELATDLTRGVLINGNKTTPTELDALLKSNTQFQAAKEAYYQNLLAIRAAIQSEKPTIGAPVAPTIPPPRTPSPTQRGRMIRTKQSNVSPRDAPKHGYSPEQFIFNLHQKRNGRIALDIKYSRLKVTVADENKEYLFPGEIHYRSDLVHGDFMFQTLSVTPSLKPFMTGNKDLDVSRLMAAQQAHIAESCRAVIQETEKTLQQFPNEETQKKLNELKQQPNSDQQLRALYQLNSDLSQKIEQQFDALYSGLKSDVERSPGTDQTMALVLESAKQFRQELSPQLPAVVAELEKLRSIGLIAGGTPPVQLLVEARFNLAKMAAQDEIAAAKALYQFQPEKYPTLPAMVQAAENELAKQQTAPVDPNELNHASQRLEGIALCLSIGATQEKSLTSSEMFDRYTQFIAAKEALRSIKPTSQPSHQQAIDDLLKDIEEKPLSHENVTDSLIRLSEMKSRIEQEKEEEVTKESPFLAARTELEHFGQEKPQFKKIIRVALKELNQCVEEDPSSILHLTEKLSQVNSACNNAQLADRSASTIDPRIVLKELINNIRAQRFKAASEKLQTTITVAKKQASTTAPLLDHAQKVLAEANSIAEEHPKDKKLLTSTLNSLNALIKTPANPANQQRYEQQRQQTLKRSQHRPWLKRIASTMSLITGGALIAAGVLGCIFTHGASLLLAGAGLAMVGASLGTMKKEKPNPDLNTPITKVLAQRARTQAPPSSARSSMPAEQNTDQSASTARPRMSV